MPRPRTVTDAAIDRAAREVFLGDGPAATVAQVAARLGVSAPAVLQRVGTKHALIARALCPGEPPGLATLAAAPPADRRARLATLRGVLTPLLAFLHLALPSLQVARAAGVPLEDLLGDQEPPPAQLRRLLARWLASAALAGAGAPARATADALVGALEARAMHTHLAGIAPVAADDARYVAELVQGLFAARRAGSTRRRTRPA